MNFKEKKILKHLSLAWNHFNDLPVEHPDDVVDFKKAIHDAQKVMSLRVAREHEPGIFISKQEVKSLREIVESTGYPIPEFQYSQKDIRGPRGNSDLPHPSFNFGQKELDNTYPVAKEEELIGLLRYIEDTVIPKRKEEYIIGSINNLLVVKPDLEKIIIDFYLSRIGSDV